MVACDQAVVNGNGLTRLDEYFDDVYIAVPTDVGHFQFDQIAHGFIHIVGQQAPGRRLPLFG